MKPIRNSAKALIIRNDHVLAVKLKDVEGFWYTLPGGGQEPGETLFETLKRECLEEVNAEVAIGELRFIREYLGKNHEFADHDTDTHQIEFMFLCHVAEDAVFENGTLPDTGQVGVEWLPLAELDNYRLYPLALRPLIPHQANEKVPVYLGDIN